MFSVEERVRLSSLMLADTLEVLSKAQAIKQVLVVSCDKRAEVISAQYDIKFLHEEKESGVNSAVAVAEPYCIGQGADATVVIPQDLPLLDTADISTACSLAANEDRCIVICPSFRYDGTNLLLRKPPAAIKTFYDNESYKAHIRAATELGIQVKLFFSKKLMADLDTPEDARQIAKEEGISRTLDFLKTKADKY